MALGQQVYLDYSAVEACEWLLIKTIKDNAGKKGLTIEEIKELLRNKFDEIYQVNKTFIFDLGVRISLQDELTNLAVNSILVSRKRTDSSKREYTVTKYGSSLIKKHLPAIQTYTKLKTI